MPTLKTILLSTSFLPVHGGVENYLNELAKACCNYDLTVCAPASPGHETFDDNTSLKIVRYNPNIEDLGYWDSIGFVRKNLTSLQRFSDKNRRSCDALLPQLFPLLAYRSLLKGLAIQSQVFAKNIDLLSTDLVQAATVVPSGITAWIIHQQLGTPYVIYTHGAELLTWERSIRTRRLLKRILQDAVWVGAVSRFTAGLLKDLGVSENVIRLIPPAIDLQPFGELQEPEKIRRRYGLLSKRIILTHGRLIPRKGHDTVIRSLPKVVAAHPDVVYLITGVGPHEGSLKALAARLDLARYVVFGGSIRPEELPALYQACDVFAVMSRTIKESVEGFGIVCLEAAAAGNPVVAARCGGLLDSVIDGVTGYHVDPENTEDLADRLCQLLDNKTLRDQLGAAGKRRVYLDFDSNAFARRVRGYIDETMRMNKRKDETLEALSVTE